MNAAGTKIIINGKQIDKNKLFLNIYSNPFFSPSFSLGFSQMNLGNYKIDFSFLGAVPTITNIKTIANGFAIENSPISQTTNIVNPAPGTITINTLNIIES